MMPNGPLHYFSICRSSLEMAEGVGNAPTSDDPILFSRQVHPAYICLPSINLVAGDGFAPPKLAFKGRCLTVKRPGRSAHDVLAEIYLNWTKWFWAEFRLTRSLPIRPEYPESQPNVQDTSNRAFAAAPQTHLQRLGFVVRKGLFYSR